MGNLLSANVLSVVVAYLLMLFVFRMAVAGLAGATDLREPDLGSSRDGDAEYERLERPERGSLTFLALIVPVLGILWMGTDQNPSWPEMFAEGLSYLGYVLSFAMFFPRRDIIGLASRRAKLWTALGSFVIGSVLVWVPQFTA